MQAWDIHPVQNCTAYLLTVLYLSDCPLQGMKYARMGTTTRGTSGMLKGFSELSKASRRRNVHVINSQASILKQASVLK